MTKLSAYERINGYEGIYKSFFNNKQESNFFTKKKNLALIVFS
ncbi:MAG: hypothetical protein AABW81_04610 [Nanoarchaeota archaeon]